jgi:hypothetical protein
MRPSTKRCTRCRTFKHRQSFPLTQSGRLSPLCITCDKTCVGCGKLTDPKEFWVSKKGTKVRNCKKCHSKRCVKTIRDSPRAKSRFYARHAAWRKLLIIETLSHYSGGTPKCSRCDESDPKKLYLKGSRYIVSIRHKRPVGGFMLYNWLKTHKFPKGYRVLCRGCPKV